MYRIRLNSITYIAGDEIYTFSILTVDIDKVWKEFQHHYHDQPQYNVSLLAGYFQSETKIYSNFVHTFAAPQRTPYLFCQ